MRKLLHIVICACALCFAHAASAQYYTWGSDAPMKWSTIRTPDVRMIYPDTVAAVAQRTLFYIRTVQPDIGHGFTKGPMRIPFVLHPENFQSNGLVMYLPKRVEFLTSPAIDSYSMPWYKQLVAHEYRHAVQYNNLNVGIPKIMSYVLGQQGSTIGLLCMPLWAMEGDAVMTETAMSSFGRGEQPSFSMGFRAMQGFSATRRNIDKWFCGSYRDYIPDHYEIGYQVCSYAYERYGENVWDKVGRFSARNIYMIATTRIALGKYYDTTVPELFHGTFDTLDSLWASLPKVEDSTTDLTPMPEGNYTTYQWPMPLGAAAVLAVKTDFDRPTRFVAIDRRTGEERKIAYTGQISTRPAMANGRVWWTEYRRSKLFEQRVNSQLCYMDLADGVTRSVAGVRRALYPTPAGNDLAWVEYSPDGRYTVVVRKAGGEEERWATQEGQEVHGLAWDDATAAFYVLITDDSGMWIGTIDDAGTHPLFEGRYITLSNLRAGGGRLYFGSIASGRDEAHCLDIASGRQYRITESEFGSFAPMSAGKDVLVTTYDRRGYRVAVQQGAEGALTEVAAEKLPKNLVNPERKKWDVVNLDTVRFTEADSVAQGEKFHTKRYRKAPNLVNIHSWIPVAFDPFRAIDEHDINVNLGLTLMSQNLLSNTEAYASYGWNGSEGSLYNLGVRYFGLGVHFDLDASYGGNQLFYSLAARDPQGNPVLQPHPDPDKYYSFGLTATLPLYFQQGYHSRLLSLSAGWNYSNGMVVNLDKIEWDKGRITNFTRIGFKEGLQKINFGVWFSDQVQMAYRDFAPRWGYAVSVNYTFNPANPHFSNLISVYEQFYLPGFLPHNSLKIQGNYQTSVGGYKFPTGYAPLSYKSSRLIPRGFTSADIMSNDYTALAADYQFPVWCPDGGIGSILYFKRIRLNIGGDYARFQRPAGNAMAWQQIWSVGGDIVFDVNLFRQPASATSTFKLSVYKPSEGSMWVGASVGLPF